ncbi:YdcF family protein [Antarctobacter sp.]|uniref:YdcF family protein n=1 Tax=Antarctobacter sp. TaxID=1872577 RepID=UPI003A95D130
MDTLFFIFSKFVGLFLQVETWLAVTLALAVIAGLLGRKGLSAWLSAAAFLAVSVISIFPIGEILLAPLEAEYVAQNIPEQIDGIIILGGAESPRKTLRWNQPQLNDASERLIAAASLAIAHPESRIVYAGGSGRLLDNVAGRAPLPPIAIEVLSSLGIDADRIIWEDQSRNTAENAQLSFELVHPEPGETWVLVTSAFHMGRAMASFEAAGWRDVVPYPVDYRTGSFTGGIGWDFSSNLEDVNIAIKEWVGRL